jgi:Zn-dependent protease
VLYCFGGLAIAGPSPYADSYSNDYSRSMTTREHILVLLAGPGIQLLFAGLLLMVIQLTGGRVEFEPRFPLFWQFELGLGTPDEYRHLYSLVDMLLQVNILWAALNLLPVFPLDGGQIAREILMWRNRARGLIQSLWTSVACGGCLVLVGLYYQDLFLAIMFGLLAVQSWLLIQQLRGRGFGEWS